MKELTIGHKKFKDYLDNNLLYNDLFYLKSDNCEAALIKNKFYFVNNFFLVRRLDISNVLSISLSFLINLILHKLCNLNI